LFLSVFVVVVVAVCLVVVVVLLFCVCFLLLLLLFWGRSVLFLTFPEHWQNQDRIEFTDA